MQHGARNAQLFRAFPSNANRVALEFMGVRQIFFVLLSKLTFSHIPIPLHDLPMIQVARLIP